MGYTVVVYVNRVESNPPPDVVWSSHKQSMDQPGKVASC